MKLPNFFLAIYLALATAQLITVRPIEEALVRCAVLALAFLVLYCLVAALQAGFRRFQRIDKNYQHTGPHGS